MNLLIFGAPGAGKGTQSEVLSRHFSLQNISIGDIFRNEVKQRTELGNKVLSYMEKGVLVPDEIVDSVVAKNIPVRDFILDGYPRNLKQAETLQGVLDKKKARIDAVVFLKVSEEKAVERLSGRRVCRKCAANYHLKNIPPAKPGICDACGEALVLRSDDKEETILKRFKVYQEESLPLLTLYKDKLVTIDADKNKDATFRDIVSALEKLQ